jgi:hypothetical protein
MTLIEWKETYWQFLHLAEMPKNKLQARFAWLSDNIDQLLSMHNAVDKVVQMSLACTDAKTGILKEFDLNFSSLEKLSTGKNGFPTALEEFIHNLCTFWCAEKRAIEELLTENDAVH